jgi:hypothetical protein
MSWEMNSGETDTRATTIPFRGRVREVEPDEV